jgi:hypothetical protein
VGLSHRRTPAVRSPLELKTNRAMRFSPIKTVAGTPSNTPPEVEPLPETNLESLPTPPLEKPSPASCGHVTLTFNEAKNGLQLHFPSKPSEEIRAELKAAGWRWSFRNGCWYHRDTPANQDFAERFVARLNRTDTETESSELKTEVPVAPVNVIPLPDLPGNGVPAWRLRLTATPKD